MIVCAAVLGCGLGTAVALPAGGPPGSTHWVGTHWVGTWAASPQKPQQGGFADQTLGLVVHTTPPGQTVRIRLSNTFGTAPVHVTDAYIGQRASGATLAGDPCS